ncbi:uncharacterized protein LOC135934808 [Cloeon dipterum]|uniref:uncharacterized protein LOC135934808 n=1 Tax=Cloeon dipterum TaxID=197152 RepID=UPI003220513C
MNGSFEGATQKGAIPKAKVAANRVVDPSTDNNNSRNSLYSEDIEDEETAGRSRRSSSPRPSTSAPIRPVTLNCTPRWRLEETSSQGKKEEAGLLDCDMDLNVLPKQMLQDLCTLNGDCDICGRTTNGKYKTCHSNGDERTDGEESDDEDEGDEEDGAVGGEELLLEVLPIRSSPDSGEGEMETHKSRSPSCSWDQQSISSGDECFYRYRGEDDEPRLAPPIENLPPNNDERRRSSSPEMDYLEMDFDPSSDWGGDEACPDEDGRQPQQEQQHPQQQQPPQEAAPPDLQRPTPEPVAMQLVQEAPPTPPPPAPIIRPAARVPREESCREMLIWSQMQAAELMQPASTPLYAAANSIFYALHALGSSTTRENIVSYLNEAHPMQSVPQTIVGYLKYRASHTYLLPFAQAYPIFTGNDLARAFGTISQDHIKARFFPILSRNLLHSGRLCRLITLWLSRGVIPIVTFSLALTDNHRHEMIFGANGNGVYTMADPNNLLTEQALKSRLAEQGTTSVSHSDVLSRYSRDQNLQPLLDMCLPWVTNNVLGTVVGILRSKSFHNQSPSPTSPGSSHHHHHHHQQPPLTFPLPLLSVSGVTLVYLGSGINCSIIESMQNMDATE